MTDEIKTLDEELGDAIDAMEMPEEEIAEVPSQEDGAPKEQEAAPEAPKEEAPVETPEGIQEPQGSVELPPGWSPGDEEVWKQLPPEAQKRVMDRQKAFQADFTKRTQEFAEKERFHDELRPIVQPYAEGLAREGQTVPQAVNQLLAIHKFSQDSPTEYLKWAAQSLNVDLASLNETGGDNEFVDPQISQLKQENAQIRQQLNQFIGTQQAQQSQSVVQTIESFKVQVGEDGKLAHPHFEKVQPRMLTILQDPEIQGIPDPAERLKQAYDQAVWLDPEIRNDLIAAQQPKVEVTAPTNVKTKGGTAAPATGSGETREQTMNRLFDEAGV